MHILDLNVAGWFSLVLQQDIYPAVLAVFHLPPHGAVSGKFGYVSGFDRFGDNIIRMRRIYPDKMVADAN